MNHVPVLLHETLEFLAIRKGGTYVDCTVGLGGHSEAILSQLDGSGQLIGLDRDRQALEEARRRLEANFSNVRMFHENFKNLPLVLNGLDIAQVDGCVADLGLSSFQLGQPDRGFSFREEGPLDMRMDLEQPTTAAQLVNELSAEQLSDIFWRYGEERQARKIAAALVERRRSARFRTTTELAELVEGIKGRGTRGRKPIHPATQVFQALRIAVNQELAGLEEFFTQLIGYLADEGRLVVISFHSLEDRIVKNVLRREAGKCVCFQPIDLCVCPRVERIRILTKKPVTPSAAEMAKNPRSRSAKLRAAEKR